MSRPVANVRAYTLRQKREARKLYYTALHLRHGVAAYTEAKMYSSLAGCLNQIIRREKMKDYLNVLTRKNVVYIHKINKDKWMKAKKAAAKKWGL
jgi:hypothetical protein